MNAKEIRACMDIQELKELKSSIRDKLLIFDEKRILGGGLTSTEKLEVKTLRLKSSLANERMKELQAETKTNDPKTRELQFLGAIVEFAKIIKGAPGQQLPREQYKTQKEKADEFVKERAQHPESFDPEMKRMREKLLAQPDKKLPRVEYDKDASPEKPDFGIIEPVENKPAQEFNDVLVDMRRPRTFEPTVHTEGIDELFKIHGVSFKHSGEEPEKDLSNAPLDIDL